MTVVRRKGSFPVFGEVWVVAFIKMNGCSFDDEGADGGGKEC